MSKATESNLADVPPEVNGCYDGRERPGAGMAAEQVERKLAAILSADVVGYSKLAGADEDRILARLRALRSDLIDPTISVHHGRVVKRTGDGTLVEFRSVVDAVRCAIEVQSGMVERNAGLPPERRIEFRIGVHLGDVVEESDGDLMGDGVNIAARLEGIAEPGGVCLSEDAYRQVRDKIKEEVADLGERNLKNITRPVRVYQLSTGLPNSNALKTAQEKAALALPERPSLAVLPFQNISGDPDQEYFVDGVTEDIITALSRVRSFFVIARNSSFTYKGKAVDVKHVGRELGVRYLVEGSVRRSGQRLRITAQLTDGFSGLQIWANRYDVEMADFFSLQDQVANSVIGAIEPRLYAAEHQRFQSRPPDNLDAWGFVMMAMPFVWTWGSAKEIEAAQVLLKRATNIDPDYPRANSLLAWTHAASATLGWADAKEVLAAARAMAQRAIQHDQEDPWTHFAAGYVHMVSRDFHAAVKDLSEAIELNPSFAFAHMILGSGYGYGGMPSEGLHHLALSSRLSPRDFTHAANLSTVGLCHFMAGRFVEAVDCERQAVELRPHFGTAWRTLAASAGMAGDHDMAILALSHAMRLHPSLSVEWIEKFHPIVHERDRAIYIAGLRAAGLR
jgi:adenylate cyclase